MTPHAYSPLGIFEPIVMLVFMLMLFVCFAGGNPEMVLKPVCEIFTHLLGAILSLLSAAISTVLRLGLSVCVSYCRN